MTKSTKNQLKKPKSTKKKSDNEDHNQLEAKGNTEQLSPKKKDSNQRIRYCFTEHSITENNQNLIFALNLHCDGWVFQHEICPETKKEHIQGYLEFKKRQSVKQFKELISPTAHVEVAKAKREDNIKYCTKKESRKPNTKPLFKGFRIKNEIPEFKPYGWQEEIIKLLELEPDDRTVIWVWSKSGKLGKSALCRHLTLKYNAIFIDEGKKGDFMNTIYKTNMDEVNIIAVDIPRDNQNKTSYKSFESIKNGIIYNSKFETGFKVFNPPHVIVFCNKPPEVEKLSFDRWKIYYIHKDGKLEKQDYNKFRVFDENSQDE